MLNKPRFLKRYQYRGEWISNWFEMDEAGVIQNFKDRGRDWTKLIERLKNGEIITIDEVQWRYYKK